MVLSIVGGRRLGCEAQHVGRGLDKLALLLLGATLHLDVAVVDLVCLGGAAPARDDGLAAVDELKDVPGRFVLSVGFGIDAFHGVCHAHVLENLAALVANDGFLGCWSLLKQSEEFAFYRAASEYVSSRLPRHPSIVNTSIIDATTGWFGNHHGTRRTEGSELFLNPLMSLFWAFSVESVARRNLYLDRIRQTLDYSELTLAIEAFHSQQPNLRPWRPIPC